MLGHLPIMPFVSGIVVSDLRRRSAIYLQNETFIKMKPTIINTLFGVVLLGGLAFGKSLLGYVFNAAFQLDDEGWRKLTLRWGIFFLFLAVLNEVVWRGATYYLPTPRRRRFLGRLQGLGHHADHPHLHHGRRCRSS